ncbi:hypothetical protein C8Q70DRAFT_1049942 [Cubamyces menziesii]|uniref:BTB domain-containing protein n=1 Tax=Trametes cubensis TaxID=1111947 RepID=A0AAD7XEX8_9APHY|nr:hypothetical protein C8Q70DRAFT_1049942 [Cubamyces menziesii]KAJ8496050.1 hypothetical protein ONZ51_g1360 [Trametes cubensis]
MTVSEIENSPCDCEAATYTIGDDSTKLPLIPFNKPFVNIVLRSSDGIEFHTLQSYLADASHVFADMFVVVEERAAQHHRNPNAAKEVDMQETADVIQALVSISHPFLPPPTFASFDIALEPFLRNEPLRVYAYVARLGPGEPASHLVKEAARACLRVPNLLQVDVPELDGIDMRTYRCLLIYRQRCISELTSSLKTIVWGPLRDLFGPEWMSKMNSGTCHQFPPTWDLSNDATRLYALRTWEGLTTDSYFRRYYGSIEELEAALRVAAACPPCAAVAFKELPSFRDALFKVVDGLVSQVEF